MSRRFVDLDGGRDVIVSVAAVRARQAEARKRFRRSSLRWALAWSAAWASLILLAVRSW